MGRINFTISDKLERSLKEKANTKFDYKKGSVSLALKEAIEEWIKRN